MPAQDVLKSEYSSFLTVESSGEFIVLIRSNAQLPAPAAIATAPAKEEKRSQPWKAHWPPQKNVANEKAYGFAEGETVAIYGN